MAGAETIDFVDTYSAAIAGISFWPTPASTPSFPVPRWRTRSFPSAWPKKAIGWSSPQARVYHRHNPTLRAYVRRKFYIGYWKALLARWHPGRWCEDSHTPRC